MTLGPAAVGSVSGLDQAAFSSNVVNSGVQAKNIFALDDNLRLTFVNSRRVDSTNKLASPRTVIKTGNASLAVTGSHPRVAVITSAFGVTPFDDFGRRIYSLATPDGRKDILQGITEISASYLRVEGLTSETSVIWDMRLSPSSIAPQQLRTILLNHIDQSNVQDWLDVVSFYAEAKRLREAREILQLAIFKFPELERMKKQLKAYDELLADQMFQEVKIRRDAGQYELASSLLRGFDRSMVAPATDLSIARELAKQDQEQQQMDGLVQSLRKLLDQIPEESLQQKLTPIVDEIQADIRPGFLTRFADFNLQTDADPPRRLSIGISNWLMGSGSPLGTLNGVMSLVRARELLTEYLATADASRRTEIAAELKQIETGAPSYLSRIAHVMRPPQELAGASNTPGRYKVELEVAALPNKPKIEYLIQLPPEYDPNRKYPCIITLHGEFSTIENQLEWWTGQYNKEFNQCIGEASRHGYIVIAPEWTFLKQAYYDYTEDEHAKVLATLRDAMRKTSIDTDAVFLSGHNMGGDAAWDIALAHPDLWAGCIPIGGNCDRYAILNFENARYVPMYFVFGELDGAPAPLARNGKYLDRLLTSQKFDAMVVMYRGRGRDHFQEEMVRLVEWANLAGHRRSFGQKEIDVSFARPGNNFFWFLELRNPKPELMVHPLQFELGQRTTVAANVMPAGNNGVRVTGVPSDGYALWLSPDFVSMTEEIKVFDKGRTRTLPPPYDSAVLLEDLRTRADRQHPFWTKEDF